MTGQSVAGSKSVVRKPGEGQARWMLGGLYEVIVSGEETGGALTVMEMTVPAGAGPPPHIHDQDELLFVLEGTVRQHIGDQTIEAGPGAVFFFPKGTLEWFEPVGGNLKVRIVYTPGGVDRFFMEVSEPAPRREIPPPLTAPPDLARLASVGARYGLELREPPQS